MKVKDLNRKNTTVLFEIVGKLKFDSEGVSEIKDSDFEEFSKLNTGLEFVDSKPTHDDGDKKTNKISDPDLSKKTKDITTSTGDKDAEDASKTLTDEEKKVILAKEKEESDKLDSEIKSMLMNKTMKELEVIALEEVGAEKSAIKKLNKIELVDLIFNASKEELK